MSDPAPPPRLWVVCPMLRDTESYLRLHDEVLDACRRDGWSDAVRFVVVDDSAGTDREVALQTAVFSRVGFTRFVRNTT